MKKLLLIILLFVYGSASDKIELKFNSFDNAIQGFKNSIITYGSNIYFYNNENESYTVIYEPKALLEKQHSFLQIFNSENFEDVLIEYRKMDDKKNLYIKKFTVKPNGFCKLFLYLFMGYGIPSYIPIEQR